MSLIGNLLSGFGKSFGANLAQNSGGLLAFLGDRILGMSKREKEANAFTAQQNQLAMDFEERMAQNSMDFESAEAAKNRAFQADQAATQWQRGVKDMQSAGLNPALAYGQGGASAMQGSMASGTSASGHAGSSVTPGTSLSELMQLATLKPQIQLMKAQARRTNAEAAVGEADAESRGALNSATISEKLQNIENLKESKSLMAFQRQALGPAQVALMKAEKESHEANKASIDANRVYTDWLNEFYRQNHYWPGENATQWFWRFLQGHTDGQTFDLPPVTGAIPFGFPKN